MKIIENSNIIDRHVKSNFMKYCVFLAVFILGVFVGTLYFNSVGDGELKEYLNNLILQVSNVENFNILNFFTKICCKNFLVFFAGVIASLSIIGVPLIFIYILYRGFTLGLTISVIILGYGKAKGFLFTMSMLYLPNFFMFIGILCLFISSLKLVRNIFMMKKDIKVEITRHIIIVIFFGIVVCVSTFFEMILAKFSLNLLS